MENTVTIPELAKQLNVTVQALHQRIKRGTLKAEKVDGTWQVSREEVQRLTNDSQGVDKDAEKGCRECELLREQADYLKKRIDWLESQLERQTILLAAEQQHRLKALPSPFNWVKRLFNRDGQ